MLKNEIKNAYAAKSHTNSKLMNCVESLNCAQMELLIKNTDRCSINNLCSRKLGLMCFILSLQIVFSLSACIHNECNIPEIIKKNQPLLKTLLNEIIYQRGNLLSDFQGYYPNTIKFDIDKFVNEINMSQYEYIKQIVFICEKLKIKTIQVDEDENVYFFLNSKSNFFRGESIEEGILIRSNYSEKLNEDLQVTNLCNILIFDNLYYVVYRITD